jgi:two-component system NtrC family sensor kinase
MALVSFGIVALAIALYLYARSEVIEPVAALLEGTHRVSRDELDVEIRVRSKGELGVLAGSFNDMTRSLSKLEGELRLLMQNLEAQVEARTAELKAAQSVLVRTEKLSSLGKLSASIAHEINNPLAGILTFAKLLIRDIEERPLDDALRGDALRQLRLVQRETERCSAIVRNLLEFARQRPAKLVQMSLAAVAEEALSLVSHQLELKGVAIERDLQPAPAILGDSGQLRQAVVNLVLNACDATPAGGRIRLATAPEAGGARLVVSDTGAGIAPEHRAHIFDPFFSTKEKGTGLGLSVVYGIVERHGGTIDVTSEPGRGSSFRILLPSAPPAGSA